MRSAVVTGIVALALGSTPAWAQPPAQELDQNWVNVCPGAVPGTPYYERCQEILNSGPGSGGRRSAAAAGNNLETVGAQGRAGRQGSDAPRFELTEGRFNFFASSGSGWQSRATTERERGFDGALQSVLFGLDYLLSSTATTGLSLLYETNGVNFESGTGDMRQRRLGALGFWNWSPAKAIAFESYAAYNRLSHNVARNINYVVTLDAGLPTQESRHIVGTARANVRGGQVQAGGGLTGDLAIRSLTLMPRAALDFCGTSLDPFAEQDDVGLAMAYDGQELRSLQSRTGVIATWAMSRAWGVLTPQVRAEFVHEFESTERDIRTRFVGDANAYRISLRTDAADADFWSLGAGTVAVLPGGFVAFVDFQGTLGRDQLKSQILTTGFRSRW